MGKGKVLLVHPSIVDFAAYDFWIKPLGLLSIGAVLAENGYDVELLDCMDRNHPSLLRFLKLNRAKSRTDGTGRFYKHFIPKPDILKNIPRRYGRYGVPMPLVKQDLARMSRPDAILVTSGMTYWYLGVVEMIRILKEHFAGVPVVLGGIYATLCGEHARRVSGADVVVEGGGERETLQIVDEITGHASETDRYRTLDDLPDPDYGLYPLLDSAAVLTSRGCPLRCPFCASHRLCGEYRRRRPQRVVEETINLTKNHGVAEIAFYDDALLFEKRSHIIPILQGMIDAAIPVHFHTPNGIQPREVDATLAGLMLEAGFQTVRLSYETANRARQEQMGLKTTDEDLKQAVNCLVEAGFDKRRLGAYVLMGLPGQETEEVVESMLFVLGLGIKVSLASFSPIPGTKSWEEAVAGAGCDLDGDPLMSNNSVFPFYSRHIPYERFIRLGTSANTANRIIQRKGNPLEDRSFLRELAC